MNNPIDMIPFQFEELDKLLLFLLFFVPGFITMKAYEMFTPWGKIDFSKRWLEAVAYSALNFIALSWLIFIVHNNKFFTNSKFWYTIGIIVIGIIFLALWGYLFFRVTRAKTFEKYTKSPYPTCWDMFFSSKESYWVILHLKNGEKVGGKYDSESYATAFPTKEQIYLEEVWKLDEETDEFIGPYDDSKGILISNDEIQYLEFFK